MAQYENKGDSLNILLADELPEDMTGTQDTQHICGKCAWYSFAKLESICRKTGKEVAFFANRECFTTEKDTTMEENTNAQPVAETGTQVCKECGRTLPLEDFQRRRNGKIDTVCKACRAEKARIGIARKKAVKVENPWLSKAKYEIEHADELLRQSQEELKEIRELKKQEQKPICDIASDDAIESCMLRYLQSAANRKDDIEIIEDTKAYKSELISIIKKEQKATKAADEPVVILKTADFSDAALLDELRRRGYKGRVSKCEEVEI